MRNVILPALVPDIRRIYDIYFAAFENEKMAQIMLKILFPGGITDEFRTAHTANTLAFWNICSYQYTMKCQDIDTGDIVGMALFDLHVKHRSEEERKNFGVPWLEGAERERAEKVLSPLWEAKEKLWGGRPYIYVHVIGVDPTHQGKHAGIALIAWGLDLCEKTGLPIYCEASPSTFKLYERYGFKVLEEKLIHKKEVLETDEDITVPLMVKMPSAAGNLSFEEWRESGYPSWDKIPKPTESTSTPEPTTTTNGVSKLEPKITARQVTNGTNGTNGISKPQSTTQVVSSKLTNGVATSKSRSSLRRFWKW